MKQKTNDIKLRNTILLIFGPAVLIMAAMLAFVIWNANFSDPEIIQKSDVQSGK
jgi:hypothetical protein